MSALALLTLIFLAASCAKDNDDASPGEADIVEVSDAGSDAGDIGSEDAGDIGSADAGAQARIEVSPGSLALVPGAEARVQARVYDADGREVDGAQVSWAMGDEAIASVNSDGVVRAGQVGQTELIASSQGVSARVDVEVGEIRRLEIVPDGGDLAAGERYSLGVVAVGRDGERYEIELAPSWRSAADDIASVDEQGVMQTHTPGFVEIEASDGDLSATATFRVDLKFEWLQCESHMCCAISRQRDTYCWGLMSARTEPYYGETTNLPTLVSAGRSFSMLAHKGYHSFCGLEDGQAFCWGNNDFNILGQPGATEIFEEPVALDTPLRFRQLALSHTAGCGLTTEGEVHCWGKFPAFGVGDGIPFQEADPSVRLIGEGPFEEIRMGHFSLCAKQADDWYCMGAGERGELGNGEAVHRDELTRIDSPVPLHDVHIGSEALPACALGEDGQVYCWGRRQFGADGHPGTPVNEYITRPRATDWSKQFLEIDSENGAAYCGVDKARDIWCWGHNRWCQLGLDPEAVASTHIPLSPVEGLPEDWTSLSVNRSAGCVLSDAGDVWCWGLQEEGLELGYGDSTCDPVARRISTF